MNGRRESGAALLVVLLMVAGMSAIAVGVLENMRRSQRLWANAASQAQAQWYALGAEAYVRVLATEADQRDFATAAFANGERAVAFPLDDGVMSLRVRDGSTCINLNGVVDGAGDIYQRNDVGAAQLRALMTAIDVPQRQADELVEALVDWIDSDSGRDGPDRDDTPYLNQSPAYLTGGQPLAEVSELRAIRGYTPDIYARLRPFVCALPATGPAPVNINALTPEQAPVLSALTEGQISVKVARDVIAGRPPGGWPDLSAFWGQSRLAGIAAPDAALQQTEIEPGYLDLVIEVSHRDAEATLSQVLARTNGGLISVARRWSLDP